MRWTERGWQLQRAAAGLATLERGSQLRAAASADVVILQAQTAAALAIEGLAQVVARARLRFRRCAYSIVIAIAARGASSWARLANFWATIYSADAVLAGNDYLRMQAASYIEPDRVHWMPTSVDPQRYPLACHHAEGARANWCGSASIARSLA